MNKHTALSLIVLTWLTATARADAPPSPNPPHPFAPQRGEAPLVLTPGVKGDPQMYVRLPGKLWRQWRADARRDEMAPWYALGSSRGSTVVAGVALTLALALAGLWLARGGRRRLLGGAMLTLTALLVAGVSGCPPRGPDSRFEFYNEPLARPIRDTDGSLKGEALLQVDDKRSSIQVVVPAEELATFVQSQTEN